MEFQVKFHRHLEDTGERHTYIKLQTPRLKWQGGTIESIAKKLHTYPTPKWNLL
jgi:hypothetical protein